MHHTTKIDHQPRFISYLLVLLLSWTLPAPATHASTLSVTSTNDSGTGSLRQAILNANANPGPDIITFALPTGSVITLQQPLPALSDAGTTIDGTLGDPTPQPSPKIVINGSNIPDSPGLVLRSSQHLITGLVLQGFRSSTNRRTPALVLAQGAHQNTIRFNYIGTDLAGQTAVANGYGLAIIQAASHNLIEYNLIAGNSEADLIIAPTINASEFPVLDPSNFQDQNIVRHNRIGSTSNGQAIIGGEQSLRGIVVRNQSRQTHIGPGNLIVGTGSSSSDITTSGIAIFGNDLASDVPTPAIPPQATLVTGNWIGTNAESAAGLGQRNRGIYIGAAQETIIGGSLSQANVIAGNNGPGIIVQESFLNQPGMQATTISYNWIGLTQTGTVLGNGSATQAGIQLAKSARHVTIGPANLISGHNGAGISIRGAKLVNLPTTNTLTITGNLIGLNADASATVANQGYGIDATGAIQRLIISTNRIAGNGLSGIHMADEQQQAPTDVRISDNLIGLLSNQQEVGNGDASSSGIDLVNLIGPIVGPGNQISGHQLAGVSFQGVRQGQISGNLLGTTSPNGQGNLYGAILTAEAQHTIIGGAGAGQCSSGPNEACNLIAGNRAYGILINAGANNNQIQGNHLEHNQLAGISIEGDPSLATDQNRISHTTTKNHSLGGIILNRQPVIGNAGGLARVVTVIRSNTTLALSLSGVCLSQDCTVEVFERVATARSDDGQRWITSATGRGTLTMPFTDSAAQLTFTATDAQGNTSVFHAVETMVFLPLIVH